MIYISVGSNVGNRMDHLWKACCFIKEMCLQGMRSSIIIETEAILPPRAPLSWNLPFLNMVVAGKTTLSPLELLDALESIERKMGRLVKL